MSNAEKSKLEIDSLHERHTGLTSSLGNALFEAASVCLNRHHESPVGMEIECNGCGSANLVEFPKPDNRILNAWANDIDTTEFGAYCVCLAAVENKEKLVAVRRAETLTGSDWYVAPIGSNPEDLETCFRLEVSGLDSGTRSAVEARLQKKMEQTRRGISNLPAIASVVGFKDKSILIQKVSKK